VANSNPTPVLSEEQIVEAKKKAIQMLEESESFALFLMDQSGNISAFTHWSLVGMDALYEMVEEMGRALNAAEGASMPENPESQTIH